MYLFIRNVCSINNFLYDVNESMTLGHSYWYRNTLSVKYFHGKKNAYYNICYLLCRLHGIKNNQYNVFGEWIYFYIDLYWEYFSFQLQWIFVFFHKMIPIMAEIYIYIVKMLCHLLVSLDQFGLGGKQFLVVLFVRETKLFF